MSRPTRLKPGKLYHIKSDGLKIQSVRMTPHLPGRFGRLGEVTTSQLKRSQMLLYVESVNVHEHVDLQESRLVRVFYSPGEKIYHFLLGEDSLWVTEKSIKKMIEFWQPSFDLSL